MTSYVGVRCSFEIKRFLISFFIFYNAMKPPIVAGKCREVFAEDPMFAFSGMSFQAPFF